MRRILGFLSLLKNDLILIFLSFIFFVGIITLRAYFSNYADDIIFSIIISLIIVYGNLNFRQR